jgi:hypothetical protein
MTTELYDQIARTGLLPTEMETAIRKGKFPPITRLVNQLLITALDSHLITSGDSAASWTERRLSVLCLVTVLILALAIEGKNGPGSSGATASVGTSK